MGVLPERYTISNAFEAIRNPNRLINEGRRILRYPLNPVIKSRFCKKYSRPTNIMEEDWDNLVILDACRYDTFSEINSIAGDLSSIVSVGSTSEEFLDKTFQDRKCHDSVYVSANVFSHDMDENVFHDFVSTYSEPLRDKESFNRYNNYRPETVYEKAIDTHKQYQDKRLIVHFMQPHAPYFGPKAEDLRDRVSSEYGVEFSAWSSEGEGDILYLMHAAEKGLISSKELREVYRENLELVLKYVEEMADGLGGKTVVTADHGELLGMNSNILVPNYEHPGYVWAPELRIVPWLEIESDSRRKIKEEKPVENKTNISDSELDEHLEALGYKA